MVCHASSHVAVISQDETFILFNGFCIMVRGAPLPVPGYAATASSSNADFRFIPVPRTTETGELKNMNL
jgi:hypothetical protein